MKAAAIGIGSNSVRMLLIDMEGPSFRRLCRDREGTRLFAGLDENGNLSQLSMDQTIAAVARMARDARAAGAEQVHLFATSATRDAGNQAEFAQRLREEAQVELEICSGTREAELSFIGATDGGYSGVIDIGGGSTEFVVGHGSHLVCGFSCQMGAVRLFQQAPITGHGDLPAVEQLATSILEDKLRHHPTLRFPERWIGTGGTFTTLSAMVKGIRWTDRTYMHGTRLTLEQVERQALLLSDMPMEERLQLPGLQPHRADIVVHGICILTAAMKRLGVNEITVSEYGNLDGYLKEKYHLTETI